jgi:hypothetical protein
MPSEGQIILTGYHENEFFERLGSLIDEKVKHGVEAALQKQQLDELNEKYLSPKEACQLFQPAITRQTLAAWTKAGKIHCKRMGKFIYYRRGDVVAAVNKIQKLKSDD